MLLEALRQVLGNRLIRRAEAAWLIAIAAQWAFVVSVLVYAYDVGGVVAVGLASTLRMIPAAVVAPFMTTIADRLPPGRVLLGVHLGRGMAVTAGAAIVIAELPAALIFVVVVIEGILATLHRPTTMALMPALARSPQELVATNAVTSTGEATGVLIGPAAGGVMLALGGPALGMGAPAVAFGVAAVAVLAIETRRSATDASPDAGAARTSELLAGFRAMRTYPSAGLLIGLFSTQTFVRGVLTVLLVAVSVELLGLGDAGVGYLNSAIGAGGLFGAAVTVWLATRRHLSTPFSLALAAWGVPILLLGLVPNPVLAFAFLAALGLANALLDVSGFSILQRCVPNRLRGRVFGALEGIATLTFGLGSLMAPFLVSVVGLQLALVLSGGLLPVLAAVSAPFVRRTDEAAVVPHHQVDLLRGVPMFAPLPMTALEQIAGGLVAEQHGSGTDVIRQGDSGDCWYLVTSGSVEVVHDGKRVAALGPGDGFGEIALLSQRPRTATVVAREDLQLYRLPRTVFLEAVTGNAHAVLAGEQLVAQRLAELGHRHDGPVSHEP